METATVGAFARIEVESAGAVRQRLRQLDGVEPFDLDEPGKVGLIIEAACLDDAHEKLTGEIKHTQGVLGVWPIYANFDGDDEPSDPDME